MNQNEPMTPSYSWLKKVNDNVFKSEGGENMRRVKNLFHEVRPAVIVTPWYKEGRFYYAMMRLFVGEDRKISDEKYKVYAPQLGDPSNPNTEHPKDFSSRVLYVIWRGRWEALEVRPIVRPYVGRDGIDISGIYDSELNGIPVVNMGVTNAQIAGESRKENKTLYFSPIWFKWIPSSLDIANKKEIAIKAKTVDVVTGSPSIEVTYGTEFIVTDVVNGTPKKTPISFVKGIKVTDGTTKKIVTLVGGIGE